MNAAAHIRVRAGNLAVIRQREPAAQRVLVWEQAKFVTVRPAGNNATAVLMVRQPLAAAVSIALAQGIAQR